MQDRKMHQYAVLSTPLTGDVNLCALPKSNCSCTRILHPPSPLPLSPRSGAACVAALGSCPGTSRLVGLRAQPHSLRCAWSRDPAFFSSPPSCLRVAHSWLQSNSLFCFCFALPARPRACRRPLIPFLRSCLLLFACVHLIARASLLLVVASEQPHRGRLATSQKPADEQYSDRSAPQRCCSRIEGALGQMQD